MHSPTPSHAAVNLRVSLWRCSQRHLNEMRRHTLMWSHHSPGWTQMTLSWAPAHLPLCFTKCPQCHDRQGFQAENQGKPFLCFCQVFCYIKKSEDTSVHNQSIYWNITAYNIKYTSVHLRNGKQKTACIWYLEEDALILILENLVHLPSPHTLTKWTRRPLRGMW